ncbi:putative Stress-inducible protein STI1-like [Balamuthia mandrillaris]
MSKKKAAEAKSKGNKYFMNNQFKEAIEWYTKAIKYDATDSTFFSNRSAAYMGVNKFEEALKDADECIKLKPDWVKGYYRKGAALTALDRHQEAVNALKQGLQVDPDNQDLQKKIEEAERELRNTVKRFDDDGNPLSPAMIAKEEGNLFFRQSNYEAAIAKYTKAIELSTNEEEKAVFYTNRATCYAQLQDHVQVVADCSEAIKVKPSAKALIRRGLAYEFLEKYKNALEDMRQALALDPSAVVASKTIPRLTQAINSF